MITLIYLTGIALVFAVAAAIADYLPWGRAEWAQVHNEWALNAAWLRYTILRHPGERQLLRRLRYRLLIAVAAPSAESSSAVPLLKGHITMTTTEPEVVRLYGADGILSAVPTVLGSHPQDSIVVVGLVSTPHRDALRVGPVSRTNLDEFEKCTLHVVATVTASLIFCDVVKVYLVTYGRNVDTGFLSAALRASGIGIAGILHVGNDAQPIDAHLKAATVALGMVIEDDRQALVARVEHRKGAQPITEVLDRLRTTTERDRYVAECMRDRDNALPLLLAACSGAMDDCLGDETPPDAARTIVSNLLAVTAVIAYRRGSSPLADAALDRSLRIDSGNNLARILAVSIQAGMPPEYLDVLAESH